MSIESRHPDDYCQGCGEYVLNPCKCKPKQTETDPQSGELFDLRFSNKKLNAENKMLRESLGNCLDYWAYVRLENEPDWLVNARKIAALGKK